MDQKQSFSWPQPNLRNLHASQASLLQVGSSQGLNQSEDSSHIGVMKEMMYKIAAMQPVVDTDPTTIQKPQRKNVRFSTDPQSVAARLRRERVSEKIRILRRMVPGGSKMDTASMLDEAILYVKFLKKLVSELQSIHPYPRCENANMDTSDWSIFPMSNMDFAAVAASSSVSSTGPAAASSSLGNLFSNTASGLLEEKYYMAHGVR